MSDREVSGAVTKGLNDEANPPRGVKRRELLKGAAAMGAVAMIPGLTSQSAQAAIAERMGQGRRPNIVFILVDEMRFPRVFPEGIHNAGEFLQAFMPRTYALWQKGVKFANHMTAATDCSPSRGVLLTGLYSHQTWFTNTLVYNPGATHASSPPLHPEFPTYGKLLREAGYLTPYAGKWHCSVPHQVDGQNPLELYGFEGLTTPDPVGNNLEGTYGDESAEQWSDSDIATQAVDWMAQAPTDQPWCLTVGFQNPHDKQYFPAGTEFQTWSNLFANAGYNPDGLQMMYDWSTLVCANGVDWSSNALANPPSYGYPPVPDNWEPIEQLATNKPSYHTLYAYFNNMVWGGVSWNQQATDFSIEPYPTTPTLPPWQWGMGSAPFSYWQRSLDSYTQIMEVLDVNVGQVLDGIPASVADNTLVIFTSDHGDYAGSHGLVSGKTATFYREAVNVPLIVYDPTGQFTGDIDVVRSGLTSSVDLLPMIVTLGHGGGRGWMKRGDRSQLYGKRHNMMPMLRSAKKAGRKAALFATDETMASEYNFLFAPTHILGMVTEEAKVGLYSRWQVGTTERSASNQQLEFYDYATPEGVLEIANTPDDPRALAMAEKLIDKLLPNELEEPLPKRYRAAQESAQNELIRFISLNESTVIGA